MVIFAFQNGLWIFFYTLLIKTRIKLEYLQIKLEF
jgi:hypothetical protein